MKDTRKTKAQLITELEELRVQVSEMEKPDTERKQAEVARQESEEKYRNLIERANDGVLIAQEGIVKFVNSHFADMHGYNVAEMINTSFLDYVYPDDRPRIMDIYKRRTQGEDIPTIYEMAGLHKDGSRIDVETNSGLTSFEGKPATLAIVRDITERKLAEEELKLHRNNLEKMVDERTQELKDAQELLISKEKLAVLGELAGGVGHELRNPLTGISNALYYLKIILPDAEEKVLDYLDLISTEVKNASSIVTNLLDLGRMQPAPKIKTSLPQIISEILEKTPPNEKVKVESQFEAGLPEVYVAPSQIRQVLNNLLTNAYQAIPEGGNIKIAAKVLEDRVHFSIMDDGIGISEKNQKKIFEPLFTTKTRGIGLGLALSNRLIKANGGEIVVESEEGKGTKFTVILPIEG